MSLRMADGSGKKSSVYSVSLSGTRQVNRNRKEPDSCMQIHYTVTNPIKTSPRTELVAVYQDELWVAGQCREAISSMERALDAPPLQRTREIRVTARTMENMCVQISEWVRQGSKDADQENWKKALERLSAAMPLVARAEYPYIRASRKNIEGARDLLKSILVDKLI